MLTVAVACGGAKAEIEPGVIAVPVQEAPTPVPPPLPTAQPLPNVVVPLSGFAWPIAGGCLPRGDQLMPNAPRPYRNGIHEGVDFYPVDNCTPIGKGTPVLAARPGVVIRADLEYKDVTQADVARYQANPNTEEALDVFRGRQVWIDHGVDGSGARIVTRYCHLSSIADGITKGTIVARGQQVAGVGNSGTPESVSNPASEMHLHFELRIGDSFLGKGQQASQVRAAYTALFGP